MDMISKEWIQKAIRPSDSRTCGNHVAGRKYSANDNKHQVWDLRQFLVVLSQDSPKIPKQSPISRLHTEFISKKMFGQVLKLFSICRMRFRK